MKRIIIMSSERSGSNLLRSMLDAHSTLHAPPAPQFVSGFRDSGLLGDLSDDDALEMLVTHALEHVKVSPAAWPSIPTAEEVHGALEVRSLWGVVDAIHGLVAADQGCDGWVSKDNDWFDHAFELFATFPNTRVIWLVRDPRAVTASMLKMTYHPKHPWVAAKKWTAEQAACLRVHQSLGAVGACIRVRYEDLVADSAGELGRVCDWLGIPYEPGMLAFNERSESQEMAAKSPYWSNLARPATTANVQKFRKSLSAHDIECVERAAGVHMELNGYEPDQVGIAGHEPTLQQRVLFRTINRLRMRLARRQAVAESLDVERTVRVQSIQRRRREVLERIRTR